ncbi:MAG: hypothetical protein WC340_11420 [Kiritimatiellia bacterium]
MQPYTGLLLYLAGMILTASAGSAPPIMPVVEVEYLAYAMNEPNNGAGPMWCYGSTCLVRQDEDVFASGLELIPNQSPLNNVRWTLFRLGANASQRLNTDPTGRQREPCPLGIFTDGRLLLSSNPTLTSTGERNGPAQPQLLIFNTRTPGATPQVSLPEWLGSPKFCEHSYRGLAVDGPKHEALYLQNVGYDTSYWSFLARDGRWSKCGSIKMPWGTEFEEPKAIRVCYQNIALRNRAAYLMGVSDVIEWVKEWREYKLILNDGKMWDYDFRRLYFCWTPDITQQPFGEWLKVADCEHCGHITNLDLWLDKQGRAHILWLEQSIWNSRVRDKFFPGEPITYALMYGIIDQGKLMRKTRLVFGGEKQQSQEIPAYGRLHATPDGRLFVFYYIRGTDAQGKAVSENRLLEIHPGATHSKPVYVPMTYPMTSFFMATERGGSAPSATLDLLGQAKGVNGISYARIRLQNKVLPGWRVVTRSGVHYMVAPGGTISPQQITHEIGLCYNYSLGQRYPGDGLEGMPPSKLKLFEDGKELGPAHTLHAQIREHGHGRFSHWQTVLYFTASDGSDPRTNGRRYTWRIKEQIEPEKNEN